jgi:hypothetical protein
MHTYIHTYIHAYIHTEWAYGGDKKTRSDWDRIASLAPLAFEGAHMSACPVCTDILTKAGMYLFVQCMSCMYIHLELGRYVCMIASLSPLVFEGARMSACPVCTDILTKAGMYVCHFMCLHVCVYTHTHTHVCVHRCMHAHIHKHTF